MSVEFLTWICVVRNVVSSIIITACVQKFAPLLRTKPLEGQKNGYHKEFLNCIVIEETNPLSSIFTIQLIQNNKTRVCLVKARFLRCSLYHFTPKSVAYTAKLFVQIKMKSSDVSMRVSRWRSIQDAHYLSLHL